MPALAGVVAKVFAAGFLKGALGRILISVALGAVQTLLAKAKAKRQAAANRGIRGERTLSGSKNSMGFIIGRYATGGQWVCTPYTFGTNNNYMTYVIVLGAVRGGAINRLIVDGTVTELATTSHATYGQDVLGKYAGKMWVKFRSGSETSADSFLLSQFGTHPDRPWASDMIGRDAPMAIVTFYYDDKLFTQYPEVRFDVTGVPMYDIRKDSTAGGTGTHRWATPSTWETTTNPVVMIYNIKRGINVQGVGVWGGEAEAEDFRFAEWSSAMNKAQTRYKAGYEVYLSDSPSDVIDELLKACSGEIADVGGTIRIVVGGIDAATYYFTDDAIVTTESNQFDPFPGVEDTVNTVVTTYVNPDALWEVSTATITTDPDHVVSDDNRVLEAELALGAVYDAVQAQDLSTTLLADHRRFRSHVHTLPVSAMFIEPLDVIAWTSEYNGYDAKFFEVGQVSADVIGCLPTLTTRERDASDYDFSGGVAYVPVSTVTTPAPTVVDGFSVSPIIFSDGTNGRRFGIQVIWEPDTLSFATSISYRTRLTANPASAGPNGSHADPEIGSFVISDGLVPNLGYDVSVKVHAPGRIADWSGWLQVTTPDIRAGYSDLIVEINQDIATAINDAGAAADTADAVREDHDALTTGFVGDLATAFAEANARAAAGLNGWVKDPTFSDWVAGNLNLTNWLSRTGTSLYALEAGGAYGGGLTINVPSGTAIVEVSASTATNCGLIGADATADCVVVEMEIDYITGNPDGVILRMEWSNDGAAWTRGDFAGVAANVGRFTAWGVTPKPGARQVLRGLWKRPAGVAGHMRLRFYPKLNTFADAQQMVVHRMNLRAATQADIDAGQTYSIASSTPGAVVTHVGAGAAIAALNSAFTARAGGLEGSVSNILGVRADLMTGTALASLLTQLQVSSATGLSAWATAQATAVTSLEGIASASYHLGVGAGGASSGLFLFARNAAGGLEQASGVKIAADQVTIQGDLFVTPGIINHNYDMVDRTPFSSPTGAVFSFLATPNTLLGKNYLQVAVNGGATVEAVSATKDTDWLSVAPATEYLVSATAFVSANNSATSTVYVEYGSVDAAGVVTPIPASRVMVIQRTNTTVVRESVSSISPATARRARFVVGRSAGPVTNTGAARAGAFSIEKKAGASLLVDGIFAVTGMAAFGGELKSSNFVAGNAGWRITQAGEAELNSLSVRRDMIIDGARSRQYLLKGSATVSATSSASPTLVSASGGTAMTWAPYIGPGLTPDNPVMIEVSCSISAPSGSTGWIYFALQQFDGSTWSTTAGFTGFYHASGAVGTEFMRQLFSQIDGENPIYDGTYRLAAYRVSGAGANPLIQNVKATLRQTTI